jgi:hypothetical protein
MASSTRLSRYVKEKKEDGSLSDLAPITASPGQVVEWIKPSIANRGAEWSRAMTWWYEPFLSRRTQPRLLMGRHNEIGDRYDCPDENETGDTHDITFQVSGFHIWTTQLAAHMIKPVISVKKPKWPAVMRRSLPAQAIAEAPGRARCVVSLAYQKAWLYAPALNQLDSASYRIRNRVWFSKPTSIRTSRRCRLRTSLRHCNYTASRWADRRKDLNAIYHGSAMFWAIEQDLHSQPMAGASKGRALERSATLSARIKVRCRSVGGVCSA